MYSTDIEIESSIGQDIDSIVEVNYSLQNPPQSKLQLEIDFTITPQNGEKITLKIIEPMSESSINPLIDDSHRKVVPSSIFDPNCRTTATLNARIVEGDGVLYVKSISFSFTAIRISLSRKFSFEFINDQKIDSDGSVINATRMEFSNGRFPGNVIKQCSSAGAIVESCSVTAMTTFMSLAIIVFTLLEQKMYK